MEALVEMGLLGEALAEEALEVAVLVMVMKVARMEVPVVGHKVGCKVAILVVTMVAAAVVEAVVVGLKVGAQEMAETRATAPMAAAVMGEGGMAVVREVKMAVGQETAEKADGEVALMVAECVVATTVMAVREVGCREAAKEAEREVEGGREEAEMDSA